jgi:PAS domain S-box-containing protein
VPFAESRSSPPTSVPASLSDEALQRQSTRLTARARVVGLVCAAGALEIALISLAGWALRVDALVRWNPAWPRMAPLTGVLVALMAASLVLPSLVAAAVRAGLRVVIGTTAALLALVHLTLSKFAPDHAAQDLLFRETLRALGESGWMAGASSMGVFALGVGLVAMSYRRVRWAQGCALTAVAIGLVGIATYFVGYPHTTFLPPYRTTALPAALAIFLLGLAQLAAFPQQGVLPLLVGADAGAYLARKLLPFAVLVPFWLRGVELVAESLGLEPHVARVVTLLGYVVGGLVLALRMATLFRRADLHRRRIEGELRDAERELRDQEERTRIALQLTGIGTFEYDLVTGRQTLSGHARTLWGLRPGDSVSPRALLRALHPKDRRLAERAPALLAPEGPGGFTFEHRVVLADGSTRWMETSGHVLFEEDGAERRPLRVVGTMRDITSQRLLDRRAHEAEERARLALDAAALGAYDFDPRTGVATFDTRVCELLGLEPCEGRHWSDLLAALDAEDRARLEAAVAAAGASGGGEGIALDCRVVEGRRSAARIVHVTGQVFLDAGSAVRVVGTLHDVTEAREAEAKFRAFADSVPALCWIMDAVGEVTYVNQPWTEYTGLESPESANLWAESLHPEDRAGSLERWERSLATGEVFEAENRLLGANGDYRWFLSRARAQRDVSGRVVRWFGTATDIDAVKALEVALRRSEASFRLFADAIPALGWSATADGAVEYVNAQWIAYTGQTAVEALADASAPLHPEDRTRTIDTWRAAVAGGYPHEVEYRLRRHDGTYRWFLARTWPQRDAKGAILRWFGTGTDIEDAKRAEQLLRHTESALREDDRRKDEFLATLAHELRNPLAPIRQASQLASMPETTPAQVQWSHGVIDRQVTRMARLLDDLLDVSRITRGRLELRKEWVTLAALVESAVETAQPLLDARQHRLVVDLPSRPARVEVDPLRMSQVIGNLLTNAAKYTEPGGDVHLSARQENGHLVVHVRDTGVGIAPEMLPHIFEMFAQASPALERTEGGLGIGLALVRGIVELHGGTVEAASEGLGKGSAFTVRVPYGLDPDSVEEDQLDGRPVRAPRVRRRVLVADDNIDGAETLATLLRVWGHEVFVAHDGEAALALADAAEPDVLLLDIGMPGRNGYEVAAEVRRRSWGDRAVLIAVTGWGHEDDRRRSLAAGFEAHFTKPVDPSALRTMLGRHVAS